MFSNPARIPACPATTNRQRSPTKTVCCNTTTHSTSPMPKSPGGLQDFTTVSQWQPVAESFNFLRMKLKIFASATGLLVGLATLTAQTNLFVAVSYTHLRAHE